MTEIGANLFDLSWVQAALHFFNLFGWGLFIAGLVVAIFDTAIEYQTMGRLNIKKQVVTQSNAPYLSMISLDVFPVIQSVSYDEASCVLKKSHHHAVEFEKMYEQGKVNELPYTCTILNKLSHNSNDVSWSGTSTLTEDFKEYLTWKGFDALRDRADFQSLFKL